MNVSRIVGLAAAIVISALQWTAFFSPSLHTHSVRAVGAAVAGDASDGALPVVVVTAHRQSWMML
jgi:hypothetical protein